MNLTTTDADFYQIRHRCIIPTTTFNQEKTHENIQKNTQDLTCSSKESNQCITQDLSCSSEKICMNIDSSKGNKQDNNKSNDFKI